MVKYDLAIELGSTNTVIYKSGLGVILKEPSLVAIYNDGKKKQLNSVGTHARDLIGKAGQGVEIFEPIVEGVVANKQLATIMLKEFLFWAGYDNISKLKVAFSVPVGITEQEKNNLLNMAYALDFHTVALVPSSVASLVGMEADITKPISHLVVNVGGGVSDVAVVTQGTIVRGGSATLSGKSLMTAIETYLREEHSLLVADKARRDILSEVVSLLENDRNQLKVTGLDVDTKNQKQVVLYTKELYPLVSHFFSKLIDIIEATISASSSEVVADISKYGIYVCGGLSKITGLEKYLREHLNYPVFIDTEPENTTIYGLGSIIEDEFLMQLALSNFK